MDVLDTMIQTCYIQTVAVLPPDMTDNVSTPSWTCLFLAIDAYINHSLGVLDFEQIAPVLVAWWINGLIFVIILSTTVLLGFLSISIFLDSSMRSPTNLLLATITALDLLACLAKAPVNIYIYLMEGYRELPSYTWCDIYFYVDNLFPPALHGTAFLLNMYLSVQRFVGVKEVRRFRAVGTYKGTFIAIVVFLLVSFTINSIYIIVFRMEAVTAIGKKALSPLELYFVQSCRIVPRPSIEYHHFVPVYCWLRLSLLQILPVMVLSVCNIALVRASYRTHVYRKRLVGSVGTVADCGQGLETTQRTTVVTVSGLVNRPGRDKGSSSLKYCSRPDLWALRVGRCQNGSVDKEGTSTRGTHCSRVWSFLIQGKVVSTASFDVSSTNMTSVVDASMTIMTYVMLTTSVDQSERSEEAGFIAARQDVIEMSLDTDRVNNDLQESNGDLTLEEVFPVDNQHTRAAGNKDCQAAREKSRDTQIIIAGSTPSRENSYNCFNDVSLFDVIPEQMASTPPGSAASQLEGAVTPSVADSVGQAEGQLPGSKAQLKRTSKLITHENLKSDRGKRSRRRGSHKLCFPGSSSEIRSTILLIVMTSCTLTTEVFTIIIIVVNFISVVIIPDCQFVTYSNLALLNMISNMLLTMTFPLNFIFLCGISQSYRKLLTDRLKFFMARVAVTLFNRTT